MVIILLSVYYGGLGHHIEKLSEDNIAAFYKLITAVQFSFGTSLGLAKISVCLLLMRIFFVRSFRITAWGVIVYCACWMIMVISIGAGLCRPFAYNWDKSIPGGKCGQLDPAYIAIAALDIIGDAMIIVLPMPSVWRLQISTVTKIGLTTVFALAFCDIIVAILRIIYLADTDFNPPADSTWVSTGTYIWSVIETSLGVTVACSPVLKPLLTSLVPRLRLTIYSRSGGISWKQKRNNEAYLDMDNGEVPLSPLTTHDATEAGSANSAQLHGRMTTKASATTPDLSIHEEVSQSHAIYVKNEVSVRRSERR